MIEIGTVTDDRETVTKTLLDTATIAYFEPVDDAPRAHIVLENGRELVAAMDYATLRQSVIDARAR